MSDDDALDEYEQFDFADINLRQAALRDIQELKGAQLAKLRAAVRALHSAELVTFKDKLSFVVGTTMAILSAYWLGHSPASFNKAYTGAAIVLFALRLLIYRAKKWHYYAFDFCYLANVVQVFQIWFSPTSIVLHRVTFGFAMGPLIWSVAIFRNSVVMHSLDKMTSFFLHMYPAAVSWTQRWHRDQRTEELLRQRPELAREWDHASLGQLVLYPLLPYLFWALAYYAKVFVISEKKIRERGYETLFSYLTRSPKSAVARIVRSAPPRWQPLAYMALHVSLSTASFALSKVFWDSFQLHTAALLAAFCWATWNGANFYFTYFARKYVSSLPRSRSEAALPEAGAAPAQPIVGADPPPAGVLPLESPVPGAKQD